MCKLSRGSPNSCISVWLCDLKDFSFIVKNDADAVHVAKNSPHWKGNSLHPVVSSGSPNYGQTTLDGGFVAFLVKLSVTIFSCYKH